VGQVHSSHNPEVDRSTIEDVRSKGVKLASASGLALNMIIISESSAEATRPARTGSYTPAGGRRSAARNDTHRYTNARRISVHTEVLKGISVPSGVPGIVLRRLTGIKGAALRRRWRDGASATLDPGDPT
jgi:hypothetical protein